MPQVPPAARPQRARDQKQASAWNDPIGIGMLVLSAMLLLALISYDPRDLPSWIPGSLALEEDTVTRNFIGVVGAILAWAGLWLAGWAIYLVPVSTTWFGVCKLASNIKVTGRSWLGVVLMVISAAAIVAVQGILSSRDDITPHGGGGGLGYLIGGSIFANLLGTLGSTVLFIAIYGVGFFLASGLHPMMVIEEVRSEIERWLEQNRIRREMAARLAEEEEIAAARAAAAGVPAPARRRKPQEVSPDIATPISTPAGKLVTPELGLTFEPKIIDASVSRAHHEDDDNKPKLSEVWQKKRAQKMEQAPHGTLGSLTVLFKDYKLPELDLLHWPEEAAKPVDKKEMLAVQETIVRALASFGVKVEAGDITRGPAITRYEVRPVDGLRVARIAALDDDIARATCAERINILAPIPGKDTVGIELANRDKVVVPIRELLEDEIFLNGKAKIPIALGKDVYGKTIIGDLAAMPHLLVAGSTGSGKSVCINGIITSLLCRFAPDELRFIMIDPKVVEMQNYAKLPHLALPVVTDPKKALMALRWVVKEMEGRYQMFASEACRNFEAFNNRNRKRIIPGGAAALAAATAGAAAPAPVGTASRNGATASRPGPAMAANEMAAAPSAPIRKTNIVAKSAAAPKITSIAPDVPFGSSIAALDEYAAEITKPVRKSNAFAQAAAMADAAQDGTHPEQVRLDYIADTDSAPWGSDDDDEDEDTTHEVNMSDDEDEDSLPIEDSGLWTGDSVPPPPRRHEVVIPDTLPYIVVIIDELADLMQTAPADIEGAIARITQMARAAGIHLIVATQTPRADVITGVIKANIPTRIAFQVASALDSRVILDRKGAENLVGKGDMLYVPPGGAQPIRSQGALVTDEEIHAIVTHCSDQGRPVYDVRVESDADGGDFMSDEDGDESNGVSSEEEETLEKCLEVMRQEKKASTSLFQRRLRLGYGRAARMMDILEMRGIIGPGDGAKPREILVSLDVI
ncbi:MAG: DNA translocase FtsK 4TM domain-containing protein [Verrucomicrobiota bacterium]